MLPTAELISAPKALSVWGLNSLDDGHYHAQFSYNKNGNPTQYFTIQEEAANQFHSTELKIHTDHGNPRYSDLYRFRMHGGLEHHGQASALSN
jgi:SUN domain-containing protein 1/2